MARTKRRDGLTGRGALIAKLTQPSRRQLIWRACVLLGGGMLIWLAFAGAVVGITRMSNPALALRFDPDDPMALAQSAYASLLSGAGRGVSGDAAAVARESLAGQAVNPRALRVLGFASDLAGKKALAKRQLLAAHRLSRRDLSTELWLIEDAVSRNDVAGALAHYDHALRTNDAIRDTLFPILTAAASDPQLRDGIARQITDRSPWATNFLVYAIENSANPATVVDIITKAGGIPSSDIVPPLEERLLQQLAIKGRGNEAVRYYLSFAGAQKSLLTTAGFDQTSIDPHIVPISWQVFRSPELDAWFEAVAGGKLQLHIAVLPEQRTVVASKLLALPLGTYALSSNQRGVNLAAEAQANWQLDCLVDGKITELWSGHSLSFSGKAIAEQVAIPRGCSAQRLSFIVAGGTGSQESELVVQSVSLQRSAS